MSNSVFEKAYVNEIDLYYKSRVINPVNGFSYNVDDMAESLGKRKNMFSFGTAKSVANVLFGLLIADGLFFFVTVALNANPNHSIGAASFISMFFLLFLCAGFAAYSGTKDNYARELKELLTHSELFNSAFRGWAHDRYDFAVSDLTDEVISDVFGVGTFKIDGNYYTAVFNASIYEVSSIRDASSKEIAVYDELKLVSKQVPLNEVPFSDKVVDKLEVTYL
jgi:hypothetical protein